MSTFIFHPRGKAQRPAITWEQGKEMRRAYWKHGKSIIQISKDTGINVSTVRRHVCPEPYAKSRRNEFRPAVGLKRSQERDDRANSVDRRKPAGRAEQPK